MAKWLCLLTLVATTGCASISDYHYHCVNKQRAKAAWKDAKKCLPSGQLCPDFAKGFQAGYLDASQGGDGTAPPTPPPCYWGPGYQTAEGLALVSKWYEGFAQGACAALHQGRDRWHNVPSQNWTCGCPNTEFAPQCSYNTESDLIGSPVETPVIHQSAQ